MTTTWPRVWPGSPCFQSGRRVNPDGSVTLLEDQFWNVTTPDGAQTRAALPDQAHIVGVNVKGDEATATAELEAAPGHVIVYTKTVPLSIVRWETSDRYNFSDAAKDRAEARQKHLDKKG